MGKKIFLFLFLKPRDPWRRKVLKSIRKLVPASPDRSKVRPRSARPRLEGKRNISQTHSFLPFSIQQLPPAAHQPHLKLIVTFLQTTGSLPSPPRPMTTPPSPEFDPANHCILASFCQRELDPADSSASTWIECYDPASNTWSHVSPIPGIAKGYVLKGSRL